MGKGPEDAYKGEHMALRARPVHSAIRTVNMIFPSLALLLWLCLHVTRIRGQGMLGLQNGFTTFNTTTFDLQLVSDSQTAYSLRPRGSSFDFIPRDYMVNRQNNSQYHLGDITIRARLNSTSTWTTIDSSRSRQKVTPQSVSGNTLAKASLAPTLNSTLLNVTRRWVVEDGVLQLLFDVNNPQTQNVILGSVGAPLEFNNIFTDRTAAQTNTICSLTDPYIGQDAGFVQVTPLLGNLPPLVVIPASGSPLEGWHNLNEVSNEASYWYGSQTFEGLYEWLFHTQAYASQEWSSTTPWNAPTSYTLKPGETRTYGLQFLLADSIGTIEDTLIDAGHPVAAGVPGYILPADQTGKLFLRYASAVQSISVTPSGALTWATNSDSAAWTGYDLTAHSFGRARLSITYQDGTLQTISYFITHAAVTSIADLGNFLTTSQWYDNESDPFGRAPSVISYDREVNAMVLNDPRVWIAGLSDEGGAGSWLAAVMKEYLQPRAAEVAKLEQFINSTVWGTLQNTDGTVKKSVFYYQPALVPGYTYPSSIDWGNWWSWDQADSYNTGRAYDYVHVAAAHWALYRVARNYPALVTVHTWDWYLSHAVTTVSAMTSGSVGYADDGLMGETVIKFLLDDLVREGSDWADEASLVESRMKARQTRWSTEQYPFGSEMAWDSTGQEGVYAWSVYFNDTKTATNTLNSIIAYQPLIPHWGYNGNARRYWDNIYGGKLMRYERMIHHYGSGLNALPLIDAFQRDPDNYFLLRLAYGGLSGPTSNIDEGGFASASFHSFPDTMKWDGYSGDYGPNFSGHSMGIGTYIINHPDFGWQAFGGNVVSAGTTIEVDLLDTGRRRVFIAPIATMLSLDAGAFTLVAYNPTNHQVTVTMASAVGQGAAAANARLVVKQTVSGYGGVGTLVVTGTHTVDAAAVVIPFSGGQATATLQ